MKPTYEELREMLATLAETSEEAVGVEVDSPRAQEVVDAFDHALETARDMLRRA